jgi:recombinational DNA repair protein RecT
MEQMDLNAIYERQFPALAQMCNSFSGYDLNNEINYFDRTVFAMAQNGYPINQLPEWSIENTLQTAVSLGLSFNPDTHHCYLLVEPAPEFGAYILKLKTGYRGEIAIATRFNVITGASATLVYEADIFEASMGDGEIVHKVRTLSNDITVRGKCVGGYCISMLTDKTKLNTFMPIEEMDAIAQMQIENCQGQTPWNGVWRDEMRKVALYRKAAKDWRARIIASNAAMAALTQTQAV